MPSSSTIASIPEEAALGGATVTDLKRMTALTWIIGNFYVLTLIS